MADLSDIMDALQAIAQSAAYPVAGGSSVSGAPIDFGQGWPLPGDIDAAMKAHRTMVSIYAVPGTTSDPGQVMCWDQQVIAPPVHNLSATTDGASVTLLGYPAVGEYATILIDGGKAYSYAAILGDLAETMCAALVAQIAADYPGTTRAGSSILISGTHTVEVRIGAPGVLGENLHRQRQQFRIVVWAPTPSDRTVVARAIDLGLKRNLTIILPDTSTALITYQGTNLDDRYENALTYRRDLMFAVLWDTVDQYDAYEVTAVNVTVNGGAPATALL